METTNHFLSYPKFSSESIDSRRIDEKRIMGPVNLLLGQLQRQRQNHDRPLPLLPSPFLPMQPNHYGMQSSFCASVLNCQTGTSKSATNQYFHNNSLAGFIATDSRKENQLCQLPSLSSLFSSTCPTYKSPIFKKISDSIPFQNFKEDVETASVKRNSTPTSTSTYIHHKTSKVPRVETAIYPSQHTCVPSDFEFKNSNVASSSETICTGFVEYSTFQKRMLASEIRCSPISPPTKQMANHKEATEIYSKRSSPVAKHVGVKESVQLQNRGNVEIVGSFAGPESIVSESNVATCRTGENRGIDPNLFDKSKGAGDSHVPSLQSTKQNPVWDNTFAFKCVHCEESFENLEGWQRHMKNVHVKRFRCTICPSRFARRYDLKKHIKIVHEKLRPFHCNECRRSFGQKHHLVRHKRALHMKQRLFICEVCPSRFSREDHLQNHHRAIHEAGQSLKYLSSGRELIGQQGYGYN